MPNAAKLAVAAAMIVATALAPTPASAATGQAHGSFSYFQVTPKVIAQGAVTNPDTGKCYPIPQDSALIVYNDTDSNGEAFRSADCTGAPDALPQSGGTIGSYGSVRFTGSSGY
ncbi:MAG TPA: hypothetical protein VE081_03915 [Sporichthyaceae bacterium]|nr:hypothetical protein [Sporichthyaceae bacterium]